MTIIIKHLIIFHSFIHCKEQGHHRVKIRMPPSRKGKTDNNCETTEMTFRIAALLNAAQGAHSALRPRDSRHNPAEP